MNNTSDRKSIILVDDHILVRTGLKELIEKIGPYTVSEEYDNGKQLTDAYPFTPAPDLIILDISMPEMDGDEAMELLNEKGNTSPVLILTLSQDDDRMLSLFRLGVRGYLQKNCSAKIMREALSEIFRCGYYHNEFLTYSLRHDYTPKEKTEQELILEQLSEKEREFLKLVCHEDEYTYEQIAGHMAVKHRTIDGYREAIFDKFTIKSKTGLVLFVLKHQLFEHL
ncbi:MAG: response regulator transcription factor [Cyclobacteriaceae bacterium]